MRLYKPGLERTEMVAEPAPLTLDFSKDVQQTLARLMGFDELNALFRLLRVDNQGRLHVNTGGLQRDQAVTASTQVGTAYIRLLQANPNRVLWIVQNTGSMPVRIGFENNFPGGIYLLQYGLLSDEIYTGEVWAYGDSSGPFINTVEI